MGARSANPRWMSHSGDVDGTMSGRAKPRLVRCWPELSLMGSPALECRPRPCTESGESWGVVGAEGGTVGFRTGRAFWDYPVAAPDFTYGTS